MSPIEFQYVSVLLPGLVVVKPRPLELYSMRKFYSLFWRTSTETSVLAKTFSLRCLGDP